MKSIKRLFNMLLHRTNIDEQIKVHQDLCVEYEDGNSGTVDIKNESWLKRKQDSIKEIFLMCMMPYM